MKKIVFLLILILISPVVATTVGDLVWEKDLAPASIADVDTSESGNLIFAALDNGTVVAYDSDGDLQWALYLNMTMKKLKTIGDGSRVITFNDLNQTYYINSVTGTVIKTIFGTNFYNVSDVGLSRNGSYFAITGNSSVVIYDQYGNPFASNLTFPENRLLNALDPEVNWVIHGIYPNQTIRWNLTRYNGWSNNNEMGDTRNASQIRLDGFAYKRYFTLVANSTYTLSFQNDTSLSTQTAQFSLIDNSTIGWNKAISKNFTILDSETLEEIVVQTNGNYSCEEGQFLNVSVKGGYYNISIMFGNNTHKPTWTGGLL